MPDRLAELEARLARVEERLAALEGGTQAPVALTDEFDEPSLGDGFVASASTHLGRVLLIFGGAYLLRAITDFNFVPTAAGLAMGAAYALFWLYFAWRKAALEATRADAVFYGATAVLLALPLLVEAATRFGLLSGPQAVAALAVFFALAMAVGFVRNLRSIAWFVTAGAAVTALVLVVTTRAAVPASAFLLLAGLTTLWTVYGRQWQGLQWLGAAAANAGAVALIALAPSPRWPVTAAAAATFAALLLLAYLASFVLRTELRKADLGVFELVQALVAMSLALRATVTAGNFLPIGGVLAIVLGAGAYGLALAARARSRRLENFYYYSAFGLLLIVAGTALVLPTGSAALAWSLLAVAFAWLSGRAGWVSLSLQCTVLLVAAGILSGLLAAGMRAFAGDPGPGWPGVTAPWVGTALATVVCLFLPVAQRSERWGVLAGLPQLVGLALSVWEVGGLAVIVAGPWLAAAGTAVAQEAILASLRTAVLAAAAVTLALSSRFPRWPEARWLVYPVLIVVGLKLFTEDFPVGQPATLFVSLAFVGGALLAVARLLRQRGDAVAA